MYEVKIRKSAIKQLSKLPSKEALWLARELSKLSNDPRPEGCMKLKGYKNQYRIRVGNYRAIYVIEDQIFVVEVTKIGNRKDIY
jgi:mRNA interferase RelE/StbE